jgi:hypothetical protein
LRKAKLGACVGVLFFALAAVAWALDNNTVDYNSPITVGSKVLGAKNIDYEGILDIGTSDNTQPNTAPLTELFFAKELKNNAKRWPSCKASDIDGKATIPAKCKKAVVGGGTADATVSAQPGSTNRVPQHLDVVALNGNKGKQILLALIGGALGAYRVIPGDLGPGNGAEFGYKVSFKVPAELQGNLSAQIALTHFDVHINKTTKIVKKVKVKGKRKKVKKTFKLGYLQLKKCPAAGTLPSRAIVHFNKDDNTAGGQVVQDDGTFACK